MKKDDIKIKISELNKIFENAQKEIEYIKSICIHEDYKISLHNFGQFEIVQRVCIYCGKSLGDPNDKELDNWKKYNLAQNL